MAEVKFNSLDFAILPVYMKPRYLTAMASVDYKVDCGANCSTVGHEWLYELGFDKDWIKSGNLLEGSARPKVSSGLSVDGCYQVILPEIRIDDWVGYNWPFITSLTVPFKFLLGTDSMRFFNWNFDYENGVCKFDLIPGKRKLLFNQQEQSIHAIDEMKR